MKILKIGAVWCPSCLIMNNTINKIKELYSIDIVCYDYDNDEEIIKKYNIGNILPVLIFVNDNGDEIKRVTGEKSKKELIEIIEELL